MRCERACSKRGRRRVLSKVSPEATAATLSWGMLGPMGVRLATLTFALAGCYSPEPSDAPADPLPLARVAVGGTHACGIDAEGELYCWGDNIYGQLGNGDDQLRVVPTPVALAGPWSEVSCGLSHTCAIGTDGDLL